MKETIKHMFFTRDLNWFSVVSIVTAIEISHTSIWYALLTFVILSIVGLVIEANLDQ